MPTNTNTPGVPTPEESALAMRNKTRAFPDDNNMSEPRCYEQCVEAPKIESVATGYESQYTD